MMERENEVDREVPVRLSLFASTCSLATCARGKMRSSWRRYVPEFLLAANV